MCTPVNHQFTVSQLIKNGNQVIFDTKVSLQCMLASTDVATGVTWNPRLGHINSTDLLKMKHGVVEGLSCSGDIKVDSSEIDTTDEEYIGPSESMIQDTVRRSERKPKPKQYEDYITYMCVDQSSFSEEAITVEEALSSPDAEKWRCAIAKELESFETNDALELQDLPQSATLVECKPRARDSKHIDVPYKQLIGSLMYLAVLTRPDIAFSISYLSQFNSCCNETLWKYAKRLLRYLKGTKDVCLCFSNNDNELQGYVNADWANSSVDRKSHTGYVFIFCGSVISYNSVKQRTVALSSTEAEYMALAEGAVYFRNLLMS
ncbi:hypothetical protein JTB14_012208 [Gonioctena quinquepunctata]|nr:hypothetical protein JTB14_012208 [Gonioctena quinquepunctata]